MCRAQGMYDSIIIIILLLLVYIPSLDLVDLLGPYQGVEHFSQGAVALSLVVQVPRGEEGGHL